MPFVPTSIVSLPKAQLVWKPAIVAPRSMQTMCGKRPSDQQRCSDTCPQQIARSRQARKLNPPLTLHNWVRSPPASLSAAATESEREPPRSRSALTRSKTPVDLRHLNVGIGLKLRANHIGHQLETRGCENREKFVTNKRDICHKHGPPTNACPPEREGHPSWRPGNRVI